MEQTLERRLSFRPLALPFEHGAWGFLLEPLLLGLLVAPSSAGAFIAVGVVGAFLVRHPLRLALQDGLRGTRYPRTLVCELFALAYAAIASFAFAGAILSAGARPLWPLAAALPLALVQFGLDVRRHGRTLAAEVLGGLAAGAGASAIVLAGRPSIATALALWLLVASRAVPSILYVRAVLGREGRGPMLASHVAAVAVAALVGPWSAIAAMAVLLVRAVPRLENARARDVGIRELAFGLVTVLLIAFGVH